MIRTLPDERRYASAAVGQERRYCAALPADDPRARRRSIRLEKVRDRTLAIDRRTGTTTTDLWPAGIEPAVEHTTDIDDWLAVIATGRWVGITPESAITGTFSVLVALTAQRSVTAYVAIAKSGACGRRRESLFQLGVACGQNLPETVTAEVTGTG